MLHELRVENLLLIDRAELRLAPGLNVVTGETGAGKTLLAQALDLLLGARPPRAGSGVVRAGAAEAYVEGVFSLPDQLAGLELLPDGADEIVLARRVWPDGRTRAYVCGRSATLGDLRELGSALISFYGQHEHRKLMLAAVQLDVLDGYCGTEHAALREEVGGAHARVRALEERAAELHELAAGRERELDLLAFELDEIERVAPSEGEAVALADERERLRHLEALRAAAFAAAEAMSGEGAGTEFLAGAAGQLQAVAGIDADLESLSERVAALVYEAQDVGAALRSYADRLEGSPGRLEEVEERLAQFARLERKHGGTIAEVLAHAERCRARREELEQAEVTLDSVEGELSAARAERDRLAAKVSARRRRAAPALAAAVRERLAELAMPEAEFTVAVGERAEGCGPRGADTVELMIAPNPGMPSGPLREIASGGELSRVMLAILSVAHGASANSARGTASEPLLVFDEIDAGIGGHTARAVGEHLRALAAGRQILCITHLPQVAAMAARHFTIAKDTGAVPARTTVTALDGDDVVGELVRMLGAGEGDRAATRHARQLLRAA